MIDVVQTVAEYYQHVDDMDTDWVLGLFAADATYYRADAVYAGKAEITKFFRDERKIQGRHTIDRMWTDQHSTSAVAVGRFDGKGINGDARSVRFADIWLFNTEGLITQRQTYLALGHKYVER